jgi:MFS family permease
LILILLPCCPSIDGRISDIFGRKSAYMFAQGAFLIGSLLCGIAPNLNFLIVARVIAGK